MPAAAAASTVSTESTAIVTSASSDAIARSRAGSTVSLASSRSVAQARGGHADDLARRRARESACALRDACTRGQRRALVRLHVWTQRRTGTSRGHGRRCCGRAPQHRSRARAWAGRRRAWCGRWDSNPHSSRNRLLRPARLPVSPRPRRRLHATDSSLDEPHLQRRAGGDRCRDRDRPVRHQPLSARGGDDASIGSQLDACRARASRHEG